MNRYRIKQIKTGYGEMFILQKKSFLGFWYNPDNIDGCITGVYDSYKNALAEYERKIAKTEIKYHDLL